MSDSVIKVEHAGMKFNLSKEKNDSLKEYFIKMILLRIILILLLIIIQLLQLL